MVSVVFVLFVVAEQEEGRGVRVGGREGQVSFFSVISFFEGESFWIEVLFLLRKNPTA